MYKCKLRLILRDENAQTRRSVCFLLTCCVNVRVFHHKSFAVCGPFRTVLLVLIGASILSSTILGYLCIMLLVGIEEWQGHDPTGSQLVHFNSSSCRIRQRVAHIHRTALA